MRHILTGLFCLISGAAFGAGEPEWWSDDPNDILLPFATNDYAAANVGQAKFMASQAIAELNEKYPVGGGATFSMSDLIDTNATANDYAALNVGQLKFLVKPFYDRVNNLSWNKSYPWTPQTTDDNDFAAVNVGQLKNAFNFDFESHLEDTDNDNLPDFWEIQIAGNLTTLTGANADPDGDFRTNIEEYYIRSNPTVVDNVATSSQISLTVITPLED